MLDLLYCLACLVALPWVAWRRLSGGRPVAHPVRRAVGTAPTANRRSDRPRIWLHGVSVGEVHLLHRLSTALPLHPGLASGVDLDCVISSATTTGLELARSRFGQERTFPAPLDFSWAVNRSLDLVDPDLIVLGELEIWPHLLSSAASRKIPIVVANGRLSERSLRGYRRLAFVSRRAFECLTLVLARSEEDASRFRSLGARRVEVTGSMKFDGVEGDRNSAEVKRLAAVAGFGKGPVFVAGSTQSPEESFALESFEVAVAIDPSLRLVIVPRHVERAGEIASLLDRSGHRWQLRSRLEAEAPDPLARILLVDTTGELSHWWGLADVAFVGGSLDGRRGGQNMLEPAAYGAAVCFGPHTRNFREETGMLVSAGAAEVVEDQRSLTAFLVRCLKDPEAARAVGDRARSLVARQRGAVSKTAVRVLEILNESYGHRSRPRWMDVERQPPAIPEEERCRLPSPDAGR